MSAQLLQTLSIISFAVAGVCLVLAVFLWFFFKIPTVIGDLSGRTARKSIAKMRATNEKTGVKVHKESKTNVERGKLTGTMPGAGKTDNEKTTPNLNGQPETGLLADNKAQSFDSEETGMLEEATGMLESEATGLLIDENATAPLASTVQNQPARTGGKKLEMIEEVMLIHTNEVI